MCWERTVEAQRAEIHIQLTFLHTTNCIKPKSNTIKHMCGHSTMHLHCSIAFQRPLRRHNIHSSKIATSDTSNAAAIDMSHVFAALLAYALEVHVVLYYLYSYRFHGGRGRGSGSALTPFSSSCMRNTAARTSCDRASSLFRRRLVAAQSNRALKALGCVVTISSSLVSRRLLRSPITSPPKLHHWVRASSWSNGVSTALLRSRSAWNGSRSK